MRIQIKRTSYVFNQDGVISSSIDNPLNLVDKFILLGSNILSPETNFSMRIGKTLIAIDRLSDHSDKIKQEFFRAVTVSILQYGCTSWTLMKLPDKKLHEDYIRILRAVLNKSWKQRPTKQQHPTKQQLYGHQPPISQTIKVRRVAHAVHHRRSKDGLTSDIFLWTQTHQHQC